MVFLTVVPVGCTAPVLAFLPLFKDMLETIFDRSFTIVSAAFTTASDDEKYKTFLQIGENDEVIK